ncbi:olfactory receptor CR1 [Cynoglossus semilaevis]|uniref:olfactory receptor CR1 n=1 Tax=Cynoglossus semilaevis TaxID=244447 RepID=UPI000D627A8C|nr:extracellular calcium-sensing receptor-like [Cynoglossus semilaevis]
MFAVEEVNSNNSLLPGLTLGYHILDNCGRYPWALQNAVTLVTGEEDGCSLTAASASTPENQTVDKGILPAPLLIGGFSSSSAIMLSRILSPLSVPVISYMASCPCLSDRTKFPFFFRTMPSDIFQARALAQLVLQFRWTWVGVVLPNSDYGHLMVQAFKEELIGKGVCLAFTEVISRQTISSDAPRVALKIRDSTARVVLILCWYTDVHKLFLELKNINLTTCQCSSLCPVDLLYLQVTDRQFLASEAWSTSQALLQDPDISSVAQGVLGVAIRSSPIPGFEKYLRSLHPITRPNDAFLREFWKQEFGCSIAAAPSTSSPSSPSESLDQNVPLPSCSGNESLQGRQHPFTDTSQLRGSYNVYLAVYAAAHALHSLLSCPGGDDDITSFRNSTCSSPKHIQPEQLLQHLSSVNVSTPQGGSFHFQGADIPATYDLVNWQKTPEGSLELVLIGRVDGLDLSLNDSVVQWSSGYSQVPESVCSKPCPPGTRTMPRKGKQLCCFDCVPCAGGEISNVTGSPHCNPCPPDFWSNSERTACIPKELDFLSFNETLGITLTTAAVSGATVTAAVLVVFLYYHQTPVVRANNSELSFLFLVSLKFCFLCSLVFIGPPSVWSCRFQQAAFGITFVLSISCLLVKTMVVLAAFRSAHPSAAAMMRWFGPAQQRASVCFFTSIQVLICTVWLALTPPEPHLDLDFRGAKVTFTCVMVSVLGFSLVLGYIGLLACSCLLLAFLARKLPDNFNEARLITFSMLIFCAVWVAFVPAYVSSPGKYVVAVEVFAILASSYGLLFCIFAPKCFIILLRPEKNSRRHLMSK